jgi:2-amino-4-hydroxy-6-hydroxymethyldihydropteridine diphosphokinase
VTPARNPFTIDTDTLTDQLRPIRRAVLGLGSNLGDRLDMLQGGVDALSSAPDVRAIAVSSVYETDPVGGPEQGPFLNAVLIVETSLQPRMLLERALAVEDAFGRERDVRWGPRTLDVDLLAVGESTLADPDLQLPHPRLHERAFVLVPWAEVDPDFAVPGLGRVSELLRRVLAADPAAAASVRRTPDQLLLPG